VDLALHLGSAEHGAALARSDRVQAEDGKPELELP
ncbi:hypothetical protein AK812_SmicGene47523, partial [Symbiodinium microadriaticum]